MSDGKIIYDVEVNDSGVESKVKSANDKVKSAADTGSSAFSEVWTGALRTVGTKIVEMGQQAIESAVDVAKQSLAQVASFEQNVGGIEKHFGDSAGVVQENAKKAFETAGLSANEYMETVTGFSASLIGSLGGNTAEAAKLADVAIRSMSDNANTFGTDMQSIMNTYQGLAKENYTMVDNLRLGYAGTKEGMKKLIEDASKMTDVQKELGLTVDGSSMDFANCVKAIEVMQASMNIAGTTSREAAGTIEGSVNSMKAAWSDFLTGTMSGEEFAQVALTAADNVVNALMEIIPRLVVGFGEMAPSLFDKAVEVVDNILTSITGKFPEVMTKGGELLGKLGDGLKNGIPQFLKKGMEMLTSFMETLKGDGGTKMIAGALSLIQSLVQGLVDAIPVLIAYVPQIVFNLVNTVVDNLPQVVQAGVDLILSIINGILNAVPKLLAELPKIITSLVEIWRKTNWLELGAMVISKIANGLAQYYRDLPNKLREIGNAAVTAFNAINWGKLGRDIIDGIINGLANAASMLFDSLTNLASSALDAAKDFLQIGSPSKVFEQEVGINVDKGWAEGEIKNADIVADATKEVADKSMDAAMDINYKLPSLAGVSKDMSASLAAKMSSTVSRVIEVPLNIDAREIARATAWDMGEQLAWEQR